MISPLSEADIDIFVVLDPSYYSVNGHASLLEKVRQVILKTYTRTPKISKNGQAVTITFSDFIVDVVPAFNRSGGGYLIPSTTQNAWIETDPTVHVNYISEQNMHNNGNLVPMIKMLKGWNMQNGVILRSFYLELIATDIYKGVTITDFPSGARYFFDKGREKVKFTARDPVPFGGNVQGLNSATVEQAFAKFQNFFEVATKAEAYANSGNVRASIDEWKKVFGSYFPSYG